MAVNPGLQLMNPGLWTTSSFLYTRKNLQKRLIAFETKELAYRTIIGITYRESKSNEYVMNLIGPVESLLKITSKKINHYGYTILHDSLHKLVVQGFVDGERTIGRPRKTLYPTFQNRRKRTSGLQRDSRAAADSITRPPTVREICSIAA